MYRPQIDSHPLAQQISYARSAKTRGGKTLIRLMENATGRIGLIRRGEGYENEIAEGRDFWDVMVSRFGLSLDVVAGSLDSIPRTGPLVVIANHPYGILDGLIMGHILAKRRGDFRILAHSIFRNAPALDKVIVPINFDGTSEAVQQNIAARRETLGYLGQGGAIGIFPGGTVSTALTPFARPLDPGWRSFTARMIAKSGATVLPIYFDGHNSRLFQLASHLHYTLRMGLLLREFRCRVDRPVRLSIGAPLSHHDIALRSTDPRALMDFLRKSTYDLSPEPIDSGNFGFEFEEKHKQKHNQRT